MPANQLVSKHRKIEIQDTVGVTPGHPASIYKDDPDEETFQNPELTTNDTGLRGLVSVPLLGTLDAGGEMLGFYLTQLDTPSGQIEKFSTIGVYEKFGGPNLHPRLPPSWNCM